MLFLKQYDKFGIGLPSAFAELGYVAAQFLDLALRKVHGDTSNKARCSKAMASVGTWQSPGGKLTMDPKTHNVIEPVYLRTVVKTRLGLHAAADLDARHLQGAGRLGAQLHEPYCVIRRSAVRDRSGAARAYERLRAEIVSGRLQPNERLVEADLIQLLGAGRSAVRTALVRLEHEGLVQHERNRGAKVRFVDEQEAAEILESRMVLEGLAARYAARNATAAQVDELLEDPGRRCDRCSTPGTSSASPT